MYHQYKTCYGAGKVCVEVVEVEPGEQVLGCGGRDRRLESVDLCWKQEGD